MDILSFLGTILILMGKYMKERKTAYHRTKDITDRLMHFMPGYNRSKKEILNSMVTWDSSVMKIILDYRGRTAFQSEVRIQLHLTRGFYRLKFVEYVRFVDKLKNYVLNNTFSQEFLTGLIDNCIGLVTGRIGEKYAEIDVKTYLDYVDSLYEDTEIHITNVENELLGQYGMKVRELTKQYAALKSELSDIVSGINKIINRSDNLDKATELMERLTESSMLKGAVSSNGNNELLKSPKPLTIELAMELHTKGVVGNSMDSVFEELRKMGQPIHRHHPSGW